MARGVNKAILLGHLGKDPEVRFTQGGSPVANFSLATSERRKQGDQWVDHVEWHNIVAFGKTAENCDQYLKKGRPIYLEGRIQTRKWEKDGVTRYSTEVVAFDVQFLGSPKGQDGGQESGGQQAPKQPANRPQNESGLGWPADDGGFDPNDEVPF